MSVRAYDPALGRFLSRDPLGRAPLYFSDQPYVYAGNNPLINVDPSGQRFLGDMGQVRAVQPTTSAGGKKRIKRERGRPPREAGGKGSENTRTGSEDLIPNNALWGKSDEHEKYTVWLKWDWDQKLGYHLNLHIRPYGSGFDLHNFHITYGGWAPGAFPYLPFIGNTWSWIYADLEGGQMGPETQQEAWAPEDINEAADNAALAMLSAMITEATMHDPESRAFFLDPDTANPLYKALAKGLVRLEEASRK
jgi:hypothetical protein